ncbi:MAG TPA: ABC transporter substrate-binding protein, partial [Candidatus Binatus sp.]|nr:ABC transporter substrate-binding protein [Candidatus Binatus sp.]
QGGRNVRKRARLKNLSILFCSVALFILTSAHAKTVTVAYPSPSWNTSLPVSTARDFGIFAAEGLDVRPVYVRGGPVVMAALLSGEADYAIMAGVTAVTSIARGADVVIVGGHTAYIDQVLVGAKGINKLSDLKGKVVGVTGAGGVTEFATVEALARKGLVRDRDYSVLYAGNSPARVNALESGVIQAGAFSANEKVIMDERGFPLLLETGKTLPEFPFMVIVTYRQKLKNNPTEVVAFLRALRNAMSTIQTRKDKVIAAAATKDPNANIHVLRKSLDYTLDSFSIALGKKNIQALVSAAKLNVNLDAPGGTEKFFVDDYLAKALNAK